jgi:hypothetical protein
MIKSRPEVFDAYWELAAERQRIFYRRLHQMPSPWTEDEILLKYRFCNAFRASDRVSQYHIRRVVYGEHLSREPEDVIFRCLLFRFFNSISTWELLERLYGDPRLSNFDVGRWYKDMDVGQGLFNAAYMTCGVKVFGYDKKHGNYLALVKSMVDDGLVERILGAADFAAVYGLLHPYKLVGKFLAYQIATDINYSDAVDFDDNTFTMAGPGAVRGINKVFADTDGRSPEYLIQWMRARQEEEFNKRGVPEGIATLWGHRLQAIDIQNMFCETDKYSRVRFPGVGGEKQKKPKQSFRVAPGPVPAPFYPPKWGINEKSLTLPQVEAIKDPDEDLPWFMG